MKTLVKNLRLMIFLSLVLLALSSCAKMTDQNGATTAPSGSDISEAGKSADLEIPSNVMQAVLTASDGSKSTLADYKGKVVLINLWATWCGPCREEMPGLVKIQDEFKDKNFAVIGVDADDEEIDLIKSFGAKMNLNYKLVKAEQDFVGNFAGVTKAGAIPQSFLINRDGKITAGWVGGGAKTLAEIRSNVAKLVGD